MANLKRLSKFLALILRHKPDDFGILLDSQGFTDLGVVQAIIEKQYPNSYSSEDLAKVVAGDQTEKKRYEIVGNKIRAMYGHGLINPIEYPPAEPPDLLYHGTNPEAVSAIRKEGLKSLKRQYVHLTTNLKIAQSVAARRTKQLVILTIHAQDAYHAGYVFYHAEAQHYLVQQLPPDYIEFPET